MQLNMRIDREFEQKLKRLVELTDAPNKTEAIKAAVDDKLAKLQRPKYDFRKVIGVAGRLKSNARFQSDDDLYRDSET
jgi:hypothetical protein